jgi:hypothetical protein
LDGLGSGGNRGNSSGKTIVAVGPDDGIEGELKLANVTDSNGVGAAGGSNYCVEGSEGTIFHVHTHLVRGVVGSLPKLDIGIKGTPLSLQQDLH